MSTIPDTTRPRRRLALAAATVVATIGLTALPASARQDPGSAATPTTTSSTTNDGRCPLRRVGTQYVRCDNLTGNGVAAPAWVLER